MALASSRMARASRRFSLSASSSFSSKSLRVAMSVSTARPVCGESHAPSTSTVSSISFCTGLSCAYTSCAAEGGADSSADSASCSRASGEPGAAAIGAGGAGGAAGAAGRRPSEDASRLTRDRGEGAMSSPTAGGGSVPAASDTSTSMGVPPGGGGDGGASAPPAGPLPPGGGGSSMGEAASQLFTRRSTTAARSGGQLYAVTSDTSGTAGRYARARWGGCSR
mmetsp:Transcript_7990/g.25688  ORF Transcript_7990/g.25688 Transcript_7990/m.25688 type:complete len:223 (-) Transcript_7990:547-1215(-)